MENPMPNAPITLSRVLSLFKPLRCKELETKFEAAANLIAKGTPTKGSAGTDDSWTKFPRHPIDTKRKLAW